MHIVTGPESINHCIGDRMSSKQVMGTCFTLDILEDQVVAKHQSISQHQLNFFRG